MTADACGEMIPSFIDRILHIGAVPSGACRQHYAQRGRVWYLPGVPAAGSAVLGGAEFDCMVIDLVTGRDDRRIDVAYLLQFLDPNGRISFVTRNGAAEDRLSESELLHPHGLLRFKTVHLQPEDGEAAAIGVVAVRRAYNPAAHAAALALKGQFQQAIAVLEDIPLELIRTDENLAYVAAEKQRLYLAWQQSLPADQPLHTLYFKARREFAQITSALPHHHPAYCREAGFWRHIGNAAMARRTLRSVLHVSPDPECQRYLDALPQACDRPSAVENAVTWSGVRRAPRILILTHDHSDYGMDTLFDALVRAIGSENVVEYPWKPMLHGRAAENAHNYPCAFDHASSPLPLASILSDLRERRFDLILYADVVQMTRMSDVRRIMEAGRDLPLVVYDTWDNCCTPVDVISNYIGGKPIDVLFKREMLADVDYGSKTIPLPFGYPDTMIAVRGPIQRNLDVFWAGKPVWGLRPLYLAAIERMLGRHLQASYPQAEYAERLRSARIGLSFFGTGFDTVRYWEIPAHGAMLLAERPPIRIPSDFTDGQSAVFFDDLPELEDKLQYYRAHVDEAEQVAAAGYRHLLAHHTTSTRAFQLLGHLEQRLTW